MNASEIGAMLSEFENDRISPVVGPDEWVVVRRGNLTVPRATLFEIVVWALREDEG